MEINNFQQKAVLAGSREQLDKAILKKKFHGCVSVERTDLAVDMTGIDYVVTLRRGSSVAVDAKTREKGASKFWKHGEPELALEIWNNVPDGGRAGTVGWTLDEATEVDYILYTFDPSDSPIAYLFSFQALRNAFIDHYQEWTKKYDVRQELSDRSDTGQSWTGEAVFVPVSVVSAAVAEWEQIDVTQITPETEGE